MPDVSFDPNWHSGLKTLPNHRYVHAADAVNPKVYKDGPSSDRWDFVNQKTIPRSRSAPHFRRQYVHDDEWSRGVKILPDARALKRWDKIPAIAKHDYHGVVEDWEYTSTMHKTLEHDQLGRTHDSWFTENSKVLPEAEAVAHYPPRHASPHPPANKLLETETLPTAEWSAGNKVVPANRYRKFMSNNQSDMSYRGDFFDSPSHKPSDGAWDRENGKVVRDHDFRSHSHHFRRVPADEWEGGAKVLPDRGVQRDKWYKNVSHPHDWFEENHKTLPWDQTHKPSPFRFDIRNTGWDSAHFKTFDPPQASPSIYGPKARIPYATLNDFYMDHKVLPPEDQHTKPSKNYLRITSQPGRSRGYSPFVPEPIRTAKPLSGSWDVENRKVLPWEVSHTTAYAGEGNRHIDLARARDIDKLHRQICREKNAYLF